MTFSEALAEGCTVNFDMRLLDVFEEMRKHDPLPERMKADYSDQSRFRSQAAAVRHACGK